MGFMHEYDGVQDESWLFELVYACSTLPRMDGGAAK